MKMYSYLKSYEVKEIKTYCQNKCKSIVINNSEDEESIDYYRGLYIGYLYGIKICNSILNSPTSFKRHEIYSHLKIQKNRVMFDYQLRDVKSSGMKDALYDLLNFIVEYEYPTNKT